MKKWTGLHKITKLSRKLEKVSNLRGKAEAYPMLALLATFTVTGITLSTIINTIASNTGTTVRVLRN